MPFLTSDGSFLTSDEKARTLLRLYDIQSKGYKGQ